MDADHTAIAITCRPYTMPISDAGLDVGNEEYRYGILDISPFFAVHTASSLLCSFPPFPLCPFPTPGSSL